MLSGGMRLSPSFRAVFACGLIYLGLMTAKATAAETSNLVYIGTYTGAKSKGIYCSRFDSKTGKLTAPELVAQTKNPSFLAVHPNGGFLYAVGELSGTSGLRAGAVGAFRIDSRTGKLTLLNRQPSGGQGPCHLSVDQSGKCVLVANYGSGSIAALPIEEDGKVARASVVIQHQGSSLNPGRQEGPHAHFIIPDPAERFALACDLGLDKVLVYRLDLGRCGLSANEPPGTSIKPGSGARHLVFHPNGRLAYVISEMGSSITAFTYDPKLGVLQEFQTVSALPADFRGKSAGAEIQIHPSGKFLYGSNRGHDSIVAFAVDQKSGKLSYVEHQPSQGKTPRHFLFDPSGKWLLVANQDSDNLVVFGVDAKTGRLTPTSESVTVGSPVCAVFATSH
jgi:6-phosphogluconolactonase